MAKKTYPKSDITRSKLIEAAQYLFVRQGYHSTSMRDIAERAELALGGIYNHFPDKESIFEAILLVGNPLVFVADTLQKSDEEARQQGYLQYVIRQLVEVYEVNPQMLNLLMIELVEFDGKHLPIMFERLYPTAQHLMENVLMHEPNLRINSPVILFRSMLGVVFAYFVTGKMVAKLNLPAENAGTLNDFIDLYLYGVLKP